MPKDTNAERRRQLKAGAIQKRHGFRGRTLNEKRTASLLDVVEEPEQRKRLISRRAQKGRTSEIRVPCLEVGKMKSEAPGSSGRRGEERLVPAWLQFFCENILLVTLSAADTVLNDAFIVNREVGIAVELNGQYICAVQSVQLAAWVLQTGCGHSASREVSPAVGQQADVMCCSKRTAHIAGLERVLVGALWRVVTQTLVRLGNWEVRSRRRGVWKAGVQ